MKTKALTGRHGSNIKALFLAVCAARILRVARNINSFDYCQTEQKLSKCPLSLLACEDRALHVHILGTQSCPLSLLCYILSLSVFFYLVLMLTCSPPPMLLPPVHTNSLKGRLFAHSLFFLVVFALCLWAA